MLLKMKALGLMKKDYQILFSQNNDNFNEDVFEVAIATLEVKGKDLSQYFNFGATIYASGTIEHFDGIESYSGNLKIARR